MDLALRPQTPSRFAKTAALAYWAAVGLLAWRVAAGAAFGLIDDHLLFPEVLRHGHWRLFWGDPSGRFYPLCGREFLVLRELGLRSAPLFYAIQTGKLLLAAFFVRGLLRRHGAGPLVASAIGLLVLFSPAFLTAVSRLFVAELTPFVLFLATLWFLPATGEDRPWRPRLSLACAAVALFHKEPGFLAVGAMGAAFVAFGVGRGSPCLRRYGAGLAVASALFFAAYLLFGLRFAGETDYADLRRIGLAQTLFYFARNDFPLFAALGAACLRLLADVRARRSPPLEAAPLAGALAYVAAFAVLRITAPWYLLPAYAFVLPILPGTLAWLGEVLPRALRLAAAPLLVAAAGVFVLAGAAQFSFNKAAARGTEALLGYLEEHRPARGEPPRILLFPGLTDDAEPAAALRVLLAARGLETAYLPVFPGEASGISMPDVQGGPETLLVLTPYARLAPRELDALRERLPGVLLETPAPARPWTSLRDALQAAFFGPDPAQGRDFLGKSLVFGTQAPSRPSP